MKRVLFKAAWVFAMLLILPWSGLALDLEGTQYVIEDNEEIPIPSAYEVKDVFQYMGDKYGNLNSPDDIFIAPDDSIYVADTGNNRILKLSATGEPLFQYTASDANGLNGPRGVFVMNNGGLLVADTNNQRILHMTAAGEFVEEFKKPDSDLLGDSVTFDPSKVYLSLSGYIYVIKSQQFLTMDTNNIFRGFVGSNEVPFSIKNTLIRIFATAEQKKNITKVQPAAYSNFLITNDGQIYATGLGKNDQIKIINSVGKNIYPTGFYGEYYVNELNEINQPNFVDLAVDDQGIISALDGTTGKIYQYDAEGNQLCVFGGLGDTRGYFSLPTSVAVDSQGNLYVLDKANNNIQVFAPTSFISHVHTAIYYYLNGDYNNARIAWENVLKTDTNYPLALKGIGKAEWKSGNYLKSMEQLRKANDVNLYSQSFDEYIHDIFRDYFTPIVLIGLVLILAIIVITIKVHAYAHTYSLQIYKIPKFFSAKLVLLTLFYPIDAFSGIKRDRKRVKYGTVVLLLLGVAVARTVWIYIEHFPLASVLPQDANFFLEMAVLLVPWVTWTISIYGITTILGGEMKLTEIITVNAYCMIPYILFSIPLAALSNIMSASEAGLYNTLKILIFIWVILLMIFAIKEMNSYTLGQTIGNSLLGIIGMLLIWCVCLLLATLTIQFFCFVESILREIRVQSLSA